MTTFTDRPLRRAAVFGAAVTLAAGVAACGSSKSSAQSPSSGSAGGGSAALPGQGKPPITIGDKNFSEEFVLGDLYAQALQAKGYTVNLKANIGSSQVIDKALTSGQIQMYPEYTGVIYTELAHLGDHPASAQVTYQGAAKWEASRGFTMLKPTPFQDADGMAVLNGFAQAHHLKTIADLASLPSFTYGGPPENATRYQGVLGLEQAYGLHNFKFVPLTIGTQYQAIDQHKVDSIAIFTTDGELASGNYTVLKDTKGIFGYQQEAPVVSTKLISEEGPQFAQILNAVSAKLTFPAIESMNKATQIDHQDPATVARQFLKANGLA